MGIIIRSIPGIIIIACAIHNGRTVHIAAHVSRCISNVDHFGSGVIDIYILGIVSRGLRGDLIRVFGPVGRCCPWTFG